jgi:hypothetical protein
MYVSRVLRLGTSGHLRAIGICAAIAVGASLGVLAPPALAAPPNDAFANRADLGDALPVHETESNEGATPDAGGRVAELAKGHSIWWEWESPMTGWITVSTCASDFQTVLNVFEGTELGHLTSLTAERSNGDEGPGCWESGTTYTFAATATHKYVIGADGNEFYPPPGPGEEARIPTGEGQVQLSVEATPVPSNDDFADAIPIGEHFSEAHESPFEPPTDDRYFVEQTPGYNWGATKQAGEPDHAGDPGGASVWYAFTPAESGEARISLQSSGGPKLLALYSGSSLSELVPVGSISEAGTRLTADVTGGTEYRIAVDGSHTENALEPWRGSFMGAFMVSMELILPPHPVLSQVEPAPSVTMSPPQPQMPSTSPPVLVAPIVKLAGHQVDPRKETATFRFGSTTKGAKFRCAVDGKSYKACSSPFTAKGLRPGKHAFRVLAGVKGATVARPAVVHFIVPTSRRRQHAAG